MSLKVSQIRPQTTEIAALKRVKKFMFPFFLALYNGSQVSIVALWATCFYFIFTSKQNYFSTCFHVFHKIAASYLSKVKSNVILKGSYSV